METPSSGRLMIISERVYRLLLLAYPREFRRTYRSEMVQTFRDCCREALQQRGQWGVLRVWGLVLYDLVTTAFAEHVRTCIAMLKRLLLNATDTLLTTERNTALVTQFHLNVAQRSDIGRQRQVNEDNMLSILPEDPQVMAKKGALFVVADGLGGHAAGVVASEMAVNTVKEAYYADGNDEVSASLLQAMKLANSAIYEANRSKNPPPENNKMMGTTCVAAVLIGDTFNVANVGDSRAYIVRGDKVIQISQDHSVVAEQVRAGLLTPDQARGHPQINLIYRCFGEKDDVEVDIFSEAVQEGDLLVLCTDGLSNLVSDEELREIVQQFGPQESVYHLVERANEHGGPDNITAIVVRVSLEGSQELQTV
jgi:serine/threonine protein phosphatase PrpC